MLDKNRTQPPGEDSDARRRIEDDDMVLNAEGPDGTIIRDGKVVKAGPRAIVGEDGTLIGMRPE